MVNSIVGVSIFKLPADLAAKLGWRSPLSCLFAGIGILIVAGCIAEVSSRYDESGGLYLYARDALGRFAGLLVAWLTWLTRIAAPAAAANLFCGYFAKFIPAVGSRRGEIILLAVLIGHLAILNYIGVRNGQHVSNFFTAVKVGFLLAFVLAGVIAWIARPALRVKVSLPSASAHDWFTAMLLLVYAYGGFEGALLVGGETKNPKRDTPLALLSALAGVGLLYTAVQLIVVAILPHAGVSERPLADATECFLGPAGAALIGLAALVSAYGYLSANVLHAPRITFAMGQQGDFPSFFSVVHPRFRTPHVSILIYTALVFIFAALGNFQWNAVLSAVSRLAVYAAIAISVPVLRLRNDGKAQFQLPLPYVFAGAALIFSLALLTQMGRAEFYVVGGTCAIALLNWLSVRR
jgi:amino acid transporter